VTKWANMKEDKNTEKNKEKYFFSISW
jgi:hypothetical protein